MSPYRRNILVGVTVLGALCVLGWMILKFGDRPAKLFASETMPIRFVSDRGDGLGDGSNITYRGVIVGRVKQVKRTLDGKQVIITGEVDKTPPLPANLKGAITTVTALGATSSLALELTDVEPKGVLPPDAELPAYFAGLQVLPPEFAELARELKATAQQFRESKVIVNLNEQIKKAGDVLDNANKLIGDPKLREDVQTALSNIRSASETINRLSGKVDKISDEASATIADVRATVNKTGANVDTITKQIGERMLQISKTLDHFQSIAGKIDAGQGTAGAMINDPKLYQSLLDTSRELNLTITDLKRLVEQWEQEGLHFKLAK